MLAVPKARHGAPKMYISSSVDDVAFNSSVSLPAADEDVYHRKTPERFAAFMPICRFEPSLNDHAQVRLACDHVANFLLSRLMVDLEYSRIQYVCIRDFYCVFVSLWSFFVILLEN